MEFKHLRQRSIHAFSVAAAILCPWMAVSNPTEPAVKTGNATFQNMDGSTLHIHTADGTVIHWNSFSIDKNEATRFILPGPNAAVLNRVTGGLSSAIAGILESNGKVYLINPSGILVDKSGVVNTASFFASTLDALDADFMAGKDIVWKGDSKAAILNLGTINAREGDLFLIGYKVENQGTLSAVNGVVGIGAGSEVLLSMEGDQRILIRPRAENGDGGIADSGYIEAIQAEIRADGSSYAQAINHSGKIQALGVEEKEGRIYLVAEGGTANCSGTMIAKNGDGTGGGVRILGDKVGLFDEAVIDASGANGGGTVYIGGGYQGAFAGSQNAQYTIGSEKILVNVSATEKGDGGTAVFWADNGCSFNGTILGRGGPQGGNGGVAEVSGRKYLDYHAKLVDLRAPMGNTGELLLDPSNITIGTAATTAGTTTSGSVAGAWYFLQNTSAAATFTTNILNTDIGTALLTAHLTVLSTRDTSGTQEGDIIVLEEAWATFDSANNLTLSASNNIYVYPTITMNELGGLVNKTGDIILNAGGDIYIGSPRHDAVPTIRPLIATTAGTNGQGNIYITAGRSVTIANDFSSAGTAGGINSLRGAVAITALNGDVSFMTGIRANTSVEAISSQRSVTITANNGMLNLLGGSTAGPGASSVVISAAAGVVANATLGLNMLGGTTDNSTVAINSGTDVEIKSALGDLNIRGGAGTAATGASITAATSLTLEATQGNILLQGGTVGGADALVTSTGGDVRVSAFGGRGITLIAGAGTTSNATISGTGVTHNVSVNAVNGNLELFGAAGATSSAQITSANTIDFTVGRDCTLRGGAGATSPITITGVNGVNGIIYGNLTLQGGTAATTPAHISNTFNNLNLAIDGNLTLLSGSTAGTTFVQIGATTGAATSNISISRVGGNAALTATQVGGLTNNYAVIGHGAPTLGATALSGEITFASGIGGDLILTGGASANNSNFAQIGHFGSTTTITSNIRINEVGNNLIFSPNEDYAAIGHGTNTVNATTITGDIYVNSTIGSCAMNLGNSAATDVFSQIGHISSTTTVGNITVNLGGSLSMRVTASTNSASLIGHGTTATPGALTGAIRVNAESLQMFGGDAALGGGIAPPISQIGFYNAGTARGSIFVETAGDMTLNGGQPTVGAGNAIIGYINYNMMGSASFENITVRSVGGNITLNGGSGVAAVTPTTGQAFIGLLQDAAGPTLHESRLLVDCPVGNLVLNGLPVSTTTFTNGFAVIRNGTVSGSPYDLTINAGTVIVNGAGTDATHVGTAFIETSRNLTIQTANDLQIVPSFGSAGIAGNAVTSDYVFQIGHDLILQSGGDIATNHARIVTPITAAGQIVSFKCDVGNDLIMRANNVAPTFIGPDPAIGMTGLNETLSMDFKIGHDLLMFGSTSGGSRASIAGFLMSGTDQNLTVRFDIGGNAFLLGGTGGGAGVNIGPTTMTSAMVARQFVDIGMKVAGDLNLKAGEGMTAMSSALIGAPSMIASSQNLNIGLDIGGSLIMNGGVSDTAFCLIGPSAMGTAMAPFPTDQNFSLTAQIGNDLKLFGGNGGTTAVHIGPVFVSSERVVSTMAFDIGGDLTMLGSAAQGTTTSIGTSPGGTGLSGSNTTFTIDCVVGGTFLMQGGTAPMGSPVLIGPNTMTASNETCLLHFDIGGDAFLLGGHINSGSHATIGPATMSLVQQFVDIGMKVGGDLNLQLAAGALGANNVLIGSPDMSNPHQNLNIVLDVGGSTILNGGSHSSSFCQIGPAAMSNMMAGNPGNNFSLSAKIGRDLTLFGSSGTTTLTHIGPRSVLSDNAVSSMAFNIGGNLSLIASSGSASTVSIGCGAFSGSTSTFNIDCTVNGTMLLQGGTGTGMMVGGMAAFIGPSSMAGLDQNCSLNFNIGGDAILLGGNTLDTVMMMPGSGANATIGPAAMSITRERLDISMTVGGDLNLTLGARGVDNFALIGSPTMTADLQTLNIGLNIGGSINLNGGNVAGSVGTVYCQIGPSSMTSSTQSFSLSANVGRDVLLIGGNDSNGSTVVLIGPRSMVGSDSISTMAIALGGDLTLQAGTVNNASACIGTSPLPPSGVSGDRDIFLVDCSVGGDFLLRAGGVTNQTAIALIGPVRVAGASTLSTTRVHAGGNGALFGGGDIASVAIIGPQTIASTISSTLVEVSTGGDLTMISGAAVSGSVLIGAPDMTGVTETLSVSVVVGETLLMDGGNGSPCRIGPLSNTEDDQTVDISLSTGRDLMITGGTGITAIGIDSFGGDTRQNGTLSLNIGGNVNLLGAALMAGGGTYIGISDLGAGTPNLLTLDLTVGDSVLVESRTGSAFIGANTLSGSENTLLLSMNLGNDLRVVSDGSTATIGSTTMSAANQTSQISIKGGRDLFLETRTPAASLVLGPGAMTGANQNSSIALDFGGNATLKGNGFSLSAGPTSMSGAMGNNRTATVGLITGGDFLMQLGIDTMSPKNIFFASPSSMAGANDVLTVNLQIGGNALLHGGTTSAAMAPFPVCQIGPRTMGGNQLFSLDAAIGGDLQLIGGSGADTTVLIGPTIMGGTTSTGRLTLGIGGDLTVLGGLAPNSTAAIGTSPVSTGVAGGNTFSVDCTVDGSFLIQAGTQPVTTALVGPIIPGTISTTRLKAGGNGVIQGGSSMMGVGNTALAIVGPQSITAPQSDTFVEVITGNDLLLRSGTGGGLNSALIGGPNMTSSNQNLFINVDVGNTLTIDGGTGGASPCQIGPLSNTERFQTVDINVSTGKDLFLIPGNLAGSTSSIGPTSFTATGAMANDPTYQIATIALDIGGNATLQSNAGARAYIGMDVFGNAIMNLSKGNLLTIDMSVGDTLLFEGLGVTSTGQQNYIGAHTMVGPDSTVAMTFTLGHDLRIIGGDNGFFIGTSTMSGDNQTLSIDIQGGRDLLIQGPTGGTGRTTYIGPLSMTAGISHTATIQMAFGGNATLLGSLTPAANTANRIYIGPQTISGNAANVEVSLSAGGDLLVVGGNQENHSVLFAAPFTMSGNNALLTANLRIGGNATLKGGTAVGPMMGTGALCQIGPQVMTGTPQNFTLDMVVGQDLKLLGGSGDISTVLVGVGSSMAGTDQTCLLAFDIGGNLSLQGGSAASTTAVIGTAISGVGLSGANEIFSIDCVVGGDLLMQGGTGADASVLIGPTIMGGANQITTTRVAVGGNATIVGGAGSMGASTEIAQIGPQSFTSTGTDALVAVTVGNDLLIKGGSAAGSSALIGAPMMTSTTQKIAVTVDSGQTLFMDGGTGGGAFCQIGPLSNTEESQFLSINVSAGKDLIMLGGNTTPIVIGATSFSATPVMAGDPTNQVGAISLDIGGNVTMQPRAGSITYIGLNDFDGSRNILTIDMAVGDSILMQAGNATVGFIGANTMTGPNNSLVASFTLGHDLKMIEGQQGFFIGTTDMSGADQRLDIDIKTGHELFIQGPIGAARSYIGPRTMSASNQIALVNLDIGGNATLLGTNGTVDNSQVFVGPFTMMMGSTNRTAAVGMKVGGNLLMKAGDGMNHSVYLASPAMAGTSDSLTLNLNVVGDISLNGGATTTGFCQIGPQAMSNNLQIYQLNIEAGGTLSLVGASAATTPTRIGSTTLLSTNGVGTINLGVGGDILLQGGTAATATVQIGTPSVSLSARNDITVSQARNVIVTGGTGAGAFALIGLGSTGNAVGDIHFGQILGDVTLGVVGSASGIGVNAFSQIGHVGNVAVSNLNGDITFDRIGGLLRLKPDNAANASAIIGHDNQFGNVADIVTGRISIHAGAAELLAGTAAGASAVIGFDPPSGAGFTLASPVVELICDRDIILTAGNVGGKAVIGYYDSGSTGTNATINTINVEADRGNITLTGASAGVNGGGFAVIGTQSSTGTCRSSIKVTTGRNLILTTTGSGGAQIVNNQAGVSSPAFSVSIDPISIIVLGGIAGGTSQISSSGNLSLIFDDRLDVNFDSIGGVVQIGNASVIAVGDIFINQTPFSYGSINIQGTNGAFTSEINSTAGSVFIGTSTSPGAGDINVGVTSATSTGATAILSAVETQINAAGNINVQGNGLCEITSSGNIHLISGNNITLGGAVGAEVSTTGGSLFLSAAGSVTGAAAAVYTAPGSILVDAGLDLTISGTGSMTSSGTGDIIANVGRDVTMSGLPVTLLGGSYIAHAGRDVNQSTTATVAAAGEIEFTAGRSVNTTGAISNGSGTISMTAGEDVNLTGGSVTSGTGNIVLEATRNINNSIVVSAPGAGTASNLQLTAGQNINSSNSLLVSGAMLLTAGRDISLTGGAVTSSDSILMKAARDIVNSTSISLLVGTGNTTLVAGQYINISGVVTHTSTGTLSLSAGEDFILSGTLNSFVGGFAGGDIYVEALRDINLTGGTMTTNGTHPIYAIAGNNFVAANNGLVSSTISQMGDGEIVLIAGRDMQLLGTTTITSLNRGFVTLVVDNLFPDSAKYGRGLLNLAVGASVNNAGGEIRLFTARQPFNTISGTLNGVPFVAGAVYVDTTTETWLSYYYRSFVGVNYMVFYKDGPTTVPPVPPVPPIVPVVPVAPGVAAAVLVFEVPFKTINLFWRATAEAFRDWAVYDEFLFDLASFETTTQCAKTGGGSLTVSDGKITSGSTASGCSAGGLSYQMLRQKYRNYHTKKLDNRY